MSTTKHSLYLIAAQFSLLVSGAVVNFGMGRLFGPSLYGQFGIVYSVATILNLLLTSGITQAVSKRCASTASFEQAKALAGNLLRRQLVLGAALGLGYYALATPLSYFLRDTSLAALLRILTPLAVIYALTAVYGGYLTGTGRFGAQASQLILYSFSRLIATLSLAYLFSVAGSLVALPLAALLSLGYLILVSKLPFFGKPVATEANGGGGGGGGAASLYLFALPITFFVGLLTVFLSTDLFLVKALLQNNTLAGYYTAAGTVARIPYFVLTALGTVLLPTVAGKLATNQPADTTITFIKSALRYVLLISIPGTVLIAATAKQLIMLLYRSEYIAAGTPLALLAIGSGALTLAYLFAIILHAAGKPLITASLAALTFILNIGLCIFLIPRHGLAGAALATTLSSFFLFAVLLVMVWRILGNPLPLGSLLKISIAAALAFGFVISALPLPSKFLLPLIYAGAGIIYAGALLLLRELKREDIERIARLLPRKLTSSFL